MRADQALELSVLPGAAVAGDERRELLRMLDAAFETDFRPFFESYVDPVHVIARHAGVLVGHAAWVPITLEHASAGALRTAYVEGVATAPSHQRRGVGTAVMERLVEEIQTYPQYDLSALSTGAPEFYARLGWRRWRGPLGVRTANGLVLSPEDELVMVLPLPATPSPLADDVLLTIEERHPESW